jgi:hypothetical protein
MDDIILVTNSWFRANPAAFLEINPIPRSFEKARLNTPERPSLRLS